jgi:hypothetical protein
MATSLRTTFALSRFGRFRGIACFRRRNARKSRGSLGGLGRWNRAIAIGLLLRCICRPVTACGTFRSGLVSRLSIRRFLCFRKPIRAIVDIR